MEPISVNYNGYTITTDKSLMNVRDIHKWLCEQSYWSPNIPLDVVSRAFEHSYCIAALYNGPQIAYARLVTDYATFAYLADVYVREEHRGLGISKKMMELIFGLEWVKGLRRIMLATKGAQGLYRKYEFTECKFPERIMELTRPEIYSPLSPEG